MFGEEAQEAPSFDALPVGKYAVELTDCMLDETGNHPMIKATFKVLEDPFKGRLIWKRFYFSDGTAKKFLPWQMGVLGVKDEINAANATNHSESARAAIDAMAKILNTTYVADVAQTKGQDGKVYNDLVLTEKKVFIETSNGLPNYAAGIGQDEGPKTFDSSEDLPF